MFGVKSFGTLSRLFFDFCLSLMDTNRINFLENIDKKLLNSFFVRKSYMLFYGYKIKKNKRKVI